MYIVVKESFGKKEILKKTNNQREAENCLIEHILEHATNADEYTSCDLEKILIEGEERVGKVTYKIEIL